MTRLVNIPLFFHLSSFLCILLTICDLLIFQVSKIKLILLKWKKNQFPTKINEKNTIKIQVI